MRKIRLPFITLALPLSCVGIVPHALKASAGTGSPVYSSVVPQSITLNDTSEANIRSYYSSLNSLDQSERKGTNLLKNLKPILQDFTYYSYDAVWKIYEITDREWALSPASGDAYGGYNSNTNTYSKYLYGSNSTPRNNPYVHTLYRNRDQNGVTVESGRIREWAYGSYDSKTIHDQNVGTNREHVWCQSRGFKADSGAEGPAGTDIHHLMSGDGYVNGKPHNNNPYGYVNKNSISIDSASHASYTSGNYEGAPLHPHAQDESTKVFEPQDCDKGDIARACFYMVACYNNLSGEDAITEFNPNLTMADYATSAGNSEASSANHAVAMGILSDLLEWHKLDPVDEYEIHRNNLIYENYQHNRNPFIDFPQWVDYIWGDSQGYAAPTTDVINGYNDSPTPIDPTPVPSSDTYTLSFNVRGTGDASTELGTNNFLSTAATSNTLANSISATSKCFDGKYGLKMGNGDTTGSFTVVPVDDASENVVSLSLTSAQYNADTGKLKITINGDTVLTSSITPGEDYTYNFDEPTDITSIKVETTFKRVYAKSLSVRVGEIEPISIALSQNSATMYPNMTVNLSATVLPEDAADKSVSWTSSDPTVANVSFDGIVTALKAGNATITAKTVNDLTATCAVTVSAGQTTYKKIASDAEIMGGTSLVIASTKSGDWVTAEPFVKGNSNLRSANATYSNGYLTPESSNCRFRLEHDEDLGYTIQDSNGLYLYAGSTSNNNLKGIASPNDQSYWNISYSNGTCSIVCTDTNYRGTMQFNGSGSNSLFSCYSSDSQTAITLFVDMSSVLAAFVTSYLYMDVYHEDLGYCSDSEHHYFDDAKAKLLALGQDYIDLFQSDSLFDQAQARYEAWAAANGELAYAQGSANNAFAINGETQGYLLIGILFFSGITVIGTLFLLKKKRHVTQ